MKPKVNNKEDVIESVLRVQGNLARLFSRIDEMQNGWGCDDNSLYMKSSIIRRAEGLDNPIISEVVFYFEPRWFCRYELLVLVPVGVEYEKLKSVDDLKILTFLVKKSEPGLCLDGDKNKDEDIYVRKMSINDILSESEDEIKTRIEREILNTLRDGRVEKGKKFEEVKYGTIGKIVATVRKSIAGENINWELPLGRKAVQMDD